MRVLLRATVVAMALGVLLVADVMAKGEALGATIGPIDNITPGTPTSVSVQLTTNGQVVSASREIPVYLTFTDPVSLDIFEFPVRWDSASSGFAAKVTLPHSGRWTVNALLRFDALNAEQIGQVGGTRSVTVAPVAAVPPASPIAPALLGAGAASAAWLLAIGAYALRRRRRSTSVTSPHVSEQLPA